MRDYRWAIWTAPVLALVLIATPPTLAGSGTGTSNGAWNRINGSSGSGSGYYAPPAYSYETPVYSSAQTSSSISNLSFSSGPPANEAEIRVILPANGTVSFGRIPLSQGAGVREYLTPPLTGDDAYGYDVQAKWMENGKEVSRTKHVTFRAGDRVSVDFR
jgi:uncharacterized protein (TIGR03000 family)